jgi:hypothetical protein
MSSPEAPVVQVGRHGVTAEPNRKRVEQLRRAFATEHYARLPAVFAPDLVNRALTFIDRDGFYERIHEGVGAERCVRANSIAAQLLYHLANDATLRSVIAEITQLSPIESFVGRVFRMTGSSGHYDSWHTDCEGARLVAMSVNLSREPYRGGRLQVRRIGAKDEVVEIHNPGLGDAVVFRIGKSLEHQISPVRGTASRTAFAGWYCAKPDQVVGTLRARLTI